MHSVETHGHRWVYWSAWDMTHESRKGRLLPPEVRGLWSVTKSPADENQLQHREKQASAPVPPKVLTGLTLAASGSSWDDAAAAVGLKAATLRRWHRNDPRCHDFIETVVRENISTANNVLSNALPRLADELLTMAMDRSVKPHSRIERSQSTSRS